MYLRYYCFYIFLVHASLSHSTEYVYPVAYCEDESAILYIHQQSPESIRLFKWNMLTKCSEEVLWSLFNPAGLRLLPNNVGFSFIDNGRLRIKNFQKRSPKTIDFDEPLYNINVLDWIDEHTCYCSAQQGDNFSLFELHDDGSLQLIKSDNNVDFLYPVKIDDQLFYIERNHSNINYRIVQTQYDLSSNKTIHEVMDFYDKPIIFLNMISAQEGFVIEHEKTMPIDETVMFFAYYQVIKEGNYWNKNLLFSFAIPTNLFLYDSQERLFESILPLLPRIIDNKIYFVDSSHNNLANLELYYFDLKNMQINKVFIPKSRKHVFVPILCNQQLCSGGTKDGNEKDTPLSLF